MSQRKEVSRRVVVKRLAQASLATGVGTLAWQVGEAHRLQVVKQTLMLPRWSADGFRLAFLSDFHADSEARAQRAAKAIDLAIAARPDVICLGGDYLTYTNETVMDRVALIVGHLKASPVPIVAIMGNHDYTVRALPEALRVFRQGGHSHPSQ